MWNLKKVLLRRSLRRDSLKNNFYLRSALFWSFLWSCEKNNSKTHGEKISSLFMHIQASLARRLWMILDSSRTTTTACARATSSHTPTGTARQQCLIHLILICNVIDNSDSVYFGSASHIYFLSHSFIPNLIVFINLTGKYERYRGKKSHFILHLARLIALGYNSIVLLIAQRVETLLCTVKLSFERDHLRLTNWCTEANTGSCQGAARISPFICNFDCTQKRSEWDEKSFLLFFLLTNEVHFHVSYLLPHFEEPKTKPTRSIFYVLTWNEIKEKNTKLV